MLSFPLSRAVIPISPRCHSREGGNPRRFLLMFSKLFWTPAYASVTDAEVFSECYHSHFPTLSFTRASLSFPRRRESMIARWFPVTSFWTPAFPEGMDSHASVTDAEVFSECYHSRFHSLSFPLSLAFIPTRLAVIPAKAGIHVGCFSCPRNCSGHPLSRV